MGKIITSNEDYAQALKKLEPELAELIDSLYRSQTGIMKRLKQVCDHVGFDCSKHEITV